MRGLDAADGSAEPNPIDVTDLLRDDLSIFLLA
jgi:hypothetical protein